MPLHHRGIIPTSSPALVSQSDLHTPLQNPIPIITKTYLISDVYKYNLEQAVFAERTALIRLSNPPIPNVAQLLRISSNQTSVSMTMRRALGIPLAQLQMPLPVERIARIAAGVLEAIKGIHRMGIVHADLNLKNVIVDDFGSGGGGVVVVDFGGCFVEGEVGRRDVTRTSSVHVVAPECLESGERVGPWVDVWGLGILVWAMLKGGGGPFGRRSGGVLEELEDVREGRVRIEDLWEEDGGCRMGRDLVLGCLEVKPWQRFCRVQVENELERLKWAEVVDYGRLKSTLTNSFVC